MDFMNLKCLTRFSVYSLIEDTMVYIQVSQKYRLSLKVRHLEVLGVLKNSLKNSISTSTVTPEMVERFHGNIFK
jgi:hypothetical protein